ncbi:glycosyl transferase [Hyaloraphidium curvatum]|nr:glycosyl transferase [Hyaloraphidium curvatum]
MADALTRWIAFLGATGGARLATLATALLGGFVRAATALGPHSGQAAPPMFGDFEAQRHWMELTLHLPPARWYFYDLGYWGLDYPPLTAYVSWLCGAIAHRIDPAFVALDASRGAEGYGLKLFMRWTVAVSELLVYLPAVYWFCRTWAPAWRDRQLLFALVYLQPALILIDHGHFQYNAVMLGLAVAAFALFCRRRYLLGSACFVLSLMFKQMALYYSLPVFVFLLAKCFDPKEGGFKLFVQLGLTVVATFALVLLPFLRDPAQLMQIVHRLFPVARGLYEDKVANVWCALSVVVKLRDFFSQGSLAILSIGATLLAALPSLVDLFLRPSSVRLLYSLVCVSLSFFLFSFQVHEKTILVPLLPISLLALDEPAAFGWMVNTACFSMFHTLLKKDGLTLQYCVLMLFWNWANSSHLRSLLDGSARSLLIGVRCSGLSRGPPLNRCFRQASYVAMLAVHAIDLFMLPPARLPDLFVVMNVLVSASVFVAVCRLGRRK